MFADLRNGIANQDAGLDDGRTGQCPRKKGIEKKNGKEQSDRTQASDKTEEEPFEPEERTKQQVLTNSVSKSAWRNQGPFSKEERQETRRRWASYLLSTTNGKAGFSSK